jgi:hypothetical protein
VSRLCFVLFHPKHTIWKFNGVEGSALVFKGARLTKGIGSIPIAYEIHNFKEGAEASSYWQTHDVADDYGQNSVRFNMGGGQPDSVMVETPPSLHASITLSPEAFSQLLAVNWKEKFLLFTASLKYPAEIPKKLPVDPETHFRDPVVLPVDSFNIDWEEQPINMNHFLNNGTPAKTGKSLSSFRLPFHLTKRLLHFVLGR